MRPVQHSRWFVSLICAIAVLTGACGGGGNGDAEPPAADGELTFVATEFSFEPSSASVAAGEFKVTLENEGSQEHDFLIEGEDDPGAEHLIHAMPGESAEGEYDLEAGSYTFYCSVPGHRESGMEGTLTVA